MALCEGHPLPAALEVATLLRIEEIKRKGGPTDWDWSRARGASDLIGSRGDILLYRGPKKGDTARVFNEFAYAVAVSAFLPGGIKIFGLHFEATARSEKSAPTSEQPAST